MLHHISEQVYNHLLHHDTIMKQRSDDSTGLDSDGVTVQSGNTEHQEPETSEEDEEVSVPEKQENMMEVLNEMGNDKN